MIIAYSLSKDGSVTKRILSGSRHPRGERRPDKHFSQTLLRAYYSLECEHGSRFRSTFTKNAIKKAHDDRVQQFEQLGT